MPVLDTTFTFAVCVAFIGYIIIRFLCFPNRRKQEANLPPPAGRRARYAAGPSVNPSIHSGGKDKELPLAAPRRSGAPSLPSLPPGAAPYKRLPSEDTSKWFDRNTVPKGLLRRHNTREGVWGMIRVNSGRLIYRVLEPVVHEYVVGPDSIAVIVPRLYHEVELLTEDTQFCVVFHQAPPSTAGSKKKD